MRIVAAHSVSASPGSCRRLPASSPSSSSSRASFRPIRWPCWPARRRRARRSSCLRQKLGLDRPLLVQLVDYYRQLLVGRPRHQPVHDAAGMGRPLCAAAGDHRADDRRHDHRRGARHSARRRLRALPQLGPLDHVLRIVTVAGLAVASFWLALMLQLFFAMELRLAAAAGAASPAFRRRRSPASTSSMP